MASHSEESGGLTTDTVDASADAVNAGAETTITPHTTNVVVWDIPSAVVVRERFRIKVGIKCSDECDLTKSDFEIHDHDGTRAATGTLTGDRWPGTTGLYVAEVELEAPAVEGLYTWSVKIPGSDGEIPHAEGSASFGVRVVSHSDYLVTVEAFDRETQQPLSAARVVMHPYKAVTDEHGRAEVRVAKGTYTLFVSQTRYLTFGMPVDVTADTTARAELDVEPVTERN
jgi:methionine-rich copper-binding protein CopC